MNDQPSPVNSDAASASAEQPAVNKPLSRRTMLKIGGTIATAAVAAPILAACGDSPTAAPASTTAPAAGATTAAGSATTAAAGTATTAVVK